MHGESSREPETSRFEQSRANTRIPTTKADSDEHSTSPCCVSTRLSCWASLFSESICLQLAQLPQDRLCPTVGARLRALAGSRSPLQTSCRLQLIRSSRMTCAPRFCRLSDFHLAQLQCVRARWMPQSRNVTATSVLHSYKS